MREGPGKTADRQERSRRTREALLDAIEGLIARDEFENSTVADIVSKAGCSVGAFYGRFANKDAAVAAVYGRRREPLTASLTALSRTAPDLEAWARGAVELALDHAAANRALLAHAAVSADAMSSMFADARVANVDLVDSICEAVAQRFAPRLSREAAASAASFALAMIGGLTRDAAVFSAGLLGPDRNRRWFIDQLQLAVTAYIRAMEEGAVATKRA